jgi:hypothetical protein
LTEAEAGTYRGFKGRPDTPHAGFFRLGDTSHEGVDEPKSWMVEGTGQFSHNIEAEFLP